MHVATNFLVMYLFYYVSLAIQLLDAYYSKSFQKIELCNIGS